MSLPFIDRDQLSSIFTSVLNFTSTLVHYTQLHYFLQWILILKPVDSL